MNNRHEHAGKAPTALKPTIRIYARTSALSAQRSALSRGFTLAELLAVVAIIGLLLAALAPSLTGLVRSAGMRGATLQLKSTLNLARQFAITHRVNTDVLFPRQGQGSNVAYCSFMIWTNSGANYSQISQLMLLPQGIIMMDEAYGSTGNIYQQNTDTVTKNLGAGNQTMAIPRVRFRSDGSLDTGATDVNIYLAEGWVTSGGATVPKPNTVYITNSINGMIGTVKVL